MGGRSTCFASRGGGHDSDGSSGESTDGSDVILMQAESDSDMDSADSLSDGAANISGESSSARSSFWSLRKQNLSTGRKIVFQISISFLTSTSFNLEKGVNLFGD